MFSKFTLHSRRSSATQSHRREWRLIRPYSNKRQELTPSKRRDRPDTTLAFQDAAQQDALPQQAAAAVVKEATGSGGINLIVNAGLQYIGYDPDIDLGIEWRLPGEEEQEPVEDIDEPPLITPDISNFGAYREASPGVNLYV